jgi:RNA recognition motif-containing protein
MTKDQLEALFSEAGLVASVRITTYVHNGESRGFGFVAMDTQADGQKAISLFNGREVGGQQLTVREDRGQSKCSFARRTRNCR